VTGPAPSAIMEAVNQVRILASNDARNRTSLRLALGRGPTRVQEADSGEAAIELHERSPPNVLVDLMPPG